MRKIYQPRIILLLVIATLLLIGFLASKPSNVAESHMASGSTEVPPNASELLWESFSQQFVSPIAGY